MQFVTINKIPVEYKTKCFNKTYDNLSASFKLTFGQGKDSKDEPEYIARTTFNKSYIIEKFTNDGINMYRVLANEGVFVIRIEDINIQYLTLLEKIIKKHPEQYCWFYKKWDRSLYKNL